MAVGHAHRILRRETKGLHVAGIVAGQLGHLPGGPAPRIAEVEDGGGEHVIVDHGAICAILDPCRQIAASGDPEDPHPAAGPAIFDSGSDISA